MRGQCSVWFGVTPATRSLPAAPLTRLDTGLLRTCAQGIPSTRPRDRRPAKDTRRAGEDKGGNTDRHGLFQEIKRAHNVGIDEILPAVSDDVGFMEARRMEDSVHALHGSLHMRAVGDRSDTIGKA
jgi:hypothetical protein